ncbi:hypothetical protein E0Z10_g7538 [Xylaria hypoxylon]|uniref:Uncharacterized protein n=1 Tax=Xylaria hypoxylon TaxID=37992 RepID=A0A4Z0YBB2_9PEZI|nr:hypothetical protein E0Z10_g7538 [Xylaria hypoxylon]
MEAIKSTFSRLSLKSSPQMRPNPHYVDDESQEYTEDEQRQGFLRPKEEHHPTEFLNASANTATKPYSVSIYRVVAIVAIAVILTATGSFFLVRSSAYSFANGWNYQDVSEHATKVIADLIATSEPAQFRMQSPCGSTPEEAKARKCNFDTISFCWLPDECYDSDLVDTFEATRNWEYYADPKGTQPISREELVGGHGNNLWVSWEYHLRHCMFMWMKLQRAVLAKGNPDLPQIDSYIASLNHTNHCATILLTDRDVAFSTLNTETLVKYPDCGML